jgi:hypothetical protein
MKSLGHKEYYSAIGIRHDEARRITTGRKYIYPLFTRQVTERTVREFWNGMDFDLMLKSYEGNCDLCWKKSAIKKMTLLRENPGMAEWWMDMEKKYSEGEYYFHMLNESTSHMLERSKGDFTSVRDPYYAKTDDHEMSCACKNTDFQ